MKSMRAKATLAAALTTAAFFAGSGAVRAEPVCSARAFPSLPDVRIVSVAAHTDLAPHCKVAGVIGTETNVDLLLPDKWTGKFGMGGGGGFGGSVVNRALIYGPGRSRGRKPSRRCSAVRPSTRSSSSVA